MGLRMDTPTRIGLGGTAVFTLAGLAAPFVTWWVSGPTMFVFALVGVWGFWPLANGLFDGHTDWPFGLIPIQTAALRVYEAAERDRANLMAAKVSNPEVMLTQFKYMMLNDKTVEILGKQPPSTQRLPISRANLSAVYPVDGLSQLNYKTPYDRVAYTDVAIRRRDLRRVLPRYSEQWLNWAGPSGI